MICRSVIKRYTETIELLVILVNLGCRVQLQNLYIDLMLVLQYFSKETKLKSTHPVVGYNYNEE